MIVKKLEEEEIYCYWYQCECGYKWISEGDNYCGGCGKEITNMEEAKEFEAKEE